MERNEVVKGSKTGGGLRPSTDVERCSPPWRSLLRRLGELVSTGAVAGVVRQLVLNVRELHHDLCVRRTGLLEQTAVKADRLVLGSDELAEYLDFQLLSVVQQLSGFVHQKSGAADHHEGDEDQCDDAGVVQLERDSEIGLVDFHDASFSQKSRDLCLHYIQ